MRSLLLVLVLAGAANAGPTAGAQDSARRYTVATIQKAGTGIAVTLKRERQRETVRVHLKVSFIDKDENCTRTLMQGDVVTAHDIALLKAEFVHDRTGAICSGPRERLLTVEGVRTPLKLPGLRKVWRRGPDLVLLDPADPASFTIREVVYQELVVKTARGESLKLFVTPVVSALADTHIDGDCVFKRGDTLAIYEYQATMLEGGVPGFLHRASGNYDECTFAATAPSLLDEARPAMTSAGGEPVLSEGEDEP
jgi:hypothetical protein